MIRPTMDNIIAYHSEVESALNEGRPLVALESTVITHGLPYPQNVETAMAMEAAVREGGATPATIAVLGGRLTAGLATDQLEYLATRPAGSERKCSRRDLALAMARGEDGATTVAARLRMGRHSAPSGPSRT